MACSDGDSFTIDSDVTYEDSLSFDGCYEASADTFNSETQYFLNGDEIIGYPGIYSSNNFDDDGDEHGTWVLAYYTTDGDFFRRCKDADEEDSSTLHPAEVVQWDCKEDGNTAEEVYPDIDAAVTITCGCDSPTPSPTPAPTPFLTPSPASSPTSPSLTTPSAPSSTPSPSSPSRTTPSTPSPAAPSQTAPSPTTGSPAVGLTAPASASPELMTETPSGEATPVGAIAGGTVAGVLVVGAVILLVLFKTGRLKCRGSSRKAPVDDVAPAPTSGPVMIVGTRVEAAAAPIARQYPAAYQYPQAL
ncbi:unnamed protein product [Ectocarpus fasciculatus]